MTILFYISGIPFYFCPSPSTQDKSTVLSVLPQKVLYVDALTKHKTLSTKSVLLLADSCKNVIASHLNHLPCICRLSVLVVYL